MARTKGCMVPGCTKRRKPLKELCKSHFETHEIRWFKCSGEAHSNPFIDHCMVCMPYWGRFPAAVLKGTPKRDTEVEP